MEDSGTAAADADGEEYSGTAAAEADGDEYSGAAAADADGAEDSGAAAATPLVNEPRPPPPNRVTLGLVRQEIVLF